MKNTFLKNYGATLLLLLGLVVGGVLGAVLGDGARVLRAPGMLFLNLVFNSGKILFALAFGLFTHMSLYNRAAQFSPYAALVGYDEIIAEAGRLTDDKLELPEHVQAELDRKFMLLQAIINEGGRPEITVTYFVPDMKKSGGAYQTLSGKLKKLDELNEEMTLTDGTRIPLKHIMTLSGKTEEY